MTRRYHQTIKPIGARQPLIRALFTHMDRTSVTLYALSAKSGIDSKVLSNWRTGKSSPRIDLFTAACQAVGLSLRMSAPSAKQPQTEQLELML